MDGPNPYEAPRAPLASEQPREGFAEPLRGFVQTTAMVRWFSILSLFVSVACGVAALLEKRATPMLIGAALTFIANAVTHWRLAGGIREADRRADLGGVTTLLSALRHSWVTSLATYGLSSFAASASPLLAAGVLGLIDALAGNAKNEAVRLRRVLRVMLAAIVVGSLITLWQKPGNVGGAAFVLGLAVAMAIPMVVHGWLVWMQLQPLDAFIADPRPQTLRPLARSHRLLWIIVTIVTTLGFLACVLAMVLVMAFAPDAPPQR